MSLFLNLRAPDGLNQGCQSADESLPAFGPGQFLDMPATGMGRDYLDEAVRQGFGDEDSAIIAKVMPTTK